MHKIPRRIAIIGGGASATLLLAALARQCPPSRSHEFNIRVFDRSGSYGTGVAYSTPHETHTLNVRAANMSAYADDPDHFANFCAGKGIAPLDFAPRPVYAEYLRSLACKASASLSVTQVTADVLHTRRRDDNMIVLTTEQGEEIFDTVILSTGNVHALEPAIARDVCGYRSNPWKSHAFEDIPRSGQVCVIGSGLSAVDTIAGLHASGFEGNIHVVSRKGWFPCRHALPQKYPSFLTEAEQRFSPSRLMARIRKEASAAKKEGIPWQSVMDSLRPVTNGIWSGWDEANRRRFMRHALTAWNVHRHRMSPTTADIIARLKSDGRIAIHRAKVIRVGAPCTVYLSHGADIACDVVFNCLGYRYDEGRTFEADYRIGPAAFGALFETTAIPEIRVQASAIAQSILN